jgi:hypothetical protein
VRSQLETSLSRLGCDRFDLYQVHAVTSVEDLDARADAFDAIFRARDEGLCRFVGITGHDFGTAAAQLEALRRYDLDTVMLPVNARMLSDVSYLADFEALVAEAAARDVGIMAIKAGADRPWAGRERWATSWYEPLRGDALAAGIDFTLSVPGVVAFATPGDIPTASAAIDAARRHRSMDATHQARAIVAAADGPVIFPIIEHA